MVVVLTSAAETSRTASDRQKTADLPPSTSKKVASPAVRAWALNAKPELMLLSFTLHRLSDPITKERKQADCAHLVDDVEALRAKLPTPDERMTAYWGEALDSFALAGKLCQEAHDESSSRSARRTARLMADGHASMKKATDREDELS